jgi:fermentation-respiration switch protein FrsA (DUF1100 family)
LLLALGILATLAVAAVLVVLVIAAYSANKVVRPRREWQPENWQAPQLALESVTFLNPAGERLHGWLLPPPPGGPVALICHGFGTNRREGQDLLPWLLEAGCGALLFDFQAHGESEGRTTTVGLRELDDFRAAVRLVQNRLGEDHPLVAIGLSMGASVAIMGAAVEPAIRGVLSDSGFATLRSAVGRSFRVFFRLPPRVFVRPTLWFAERFTGGRIAGVLPLESVAAIAPRPLLLIQGTDDGIVDPADAQLLYAAASEPKQLWIVPDCGHVQARNLHPEEYRRRLLELLARVAPRAPDTAVKAAALAR